MSEAKTMIHEVEIKNGGKSARVLFHARDLDTARAIVDQNEEMPVAGYILLEHRIRRRQKGGRLRYLTMVFRHTGRSAPLHHES